MSDPSTNFPATVFFEAALQPERWPTVLEKMLKSLGQTAAAMSGQSQVDLIGPFFSWGLDEERIATFMSDYASSKENLAFDVFDKAPVGVATKWSDLVPVETWNDYPIGRDLILPMGIEWKYAVNLFWDGAYGGLLSVLGPPEGHDVQASDLEQATAHCQYLAPAFEMTCRMALAERENKSLWDALSHLGLGLALQDRSGRTRRLNQRAEDLLGYSDQPLHDKNPLESLLPREVTQSFSLVTNAVGGSVVMLRLPIRPSSIGRWTDEDSSLVVLIEMDRDASNINTLLTSIFGATPRQIEVAELLFEGATSTEIAAQLGISAHTVDTHIDRLCLLAGTQNRTMLRNWMMQLRGIV